MLDFSVQQYRFASGLAEGIEPHQAPPGTLLTAENVVWKKDGRLEKRPGTTLLTTSVGSASAALWGTGATIGAATRLFTRGSELCLVDGSNLYAYGPDVSLWRNVGPVPTASLDWTTVLDATTGVAAADMAVSSTGIQVIAWIVGEPTNAYGTTGACRFMVRGANGEMLFPPTDANGGTNHLVRVLVIGTTAYIFYQNTTSIVATTVNLTTMVAAAFGAVVTNVKVQGWDACVVGSTIVFAYEDTGGGLKLKSVSTALAGVATGSIAGEAGTSINCISIDGDTGGVLYVGYYVDSSGLIRGACANSSTLVQTVAPVTLENINAGPARTCTKVGTCILTGSSAMIAWSPQDNGTTLPARTSAKTFTSAGVAAASGNTWGVNLLTAPFMLSGRCYAMVIDRPRFGAPIVTAGLHTTLLRLDQVTISATAPHTYVGKVDTLTGGLTIAGAVARGAVLGTAAYWPVPFISSANGAAPPYRNGVRIAHAAAPGSDFYRSALFGQEVYFAGGPLSAYDGQGVFDYGFEREPFIGGYTNAAGAIINGTYLYAFVREWRSAAGVLHRSPVSIVSTKPVVAGPQGLTITVLPGPVGAKQNAATNWGSASYSPVINAMYRSVASGTVLQRLTVDPTYNTSIADSTAVSDSPLDARADTDVGNGIALAARPAVYTTGGILDDFQPVSGITLTYHVDRLWLLAGDQKTWWYSKAFQDDLGTAPGFHPNFRIVFADTQVAMASMDDKAIFFSATGVKYMLGTGPAPNGLNSDFQTPTTIQSDVGCTNARSVVTTPDGVMFLSDRGIYLLDRGMSLSWIGRDVKDTLAAFPTVTSAVLVAKQNQVRFTCNNAGGTAGCTLVYDYVYRRWTTLKHAQGVAGANGIAIADACMWNGAWTFVTAAGQVYTESTTSYLDGGGWVPITLETSWITPPPSQASPSSGPLKFQSVREFSLHGVSNTDHDLTLAVGFDTDPSYPQTITFTATTPVVAVGPLEECSITIGTRRKCNAIRFKITDASPSAGTLGTGQGPSFDMMGLETGAKRGFGNTLATKKG